MSNILRETDMTRAYFNCPLCERQGTPNVPMTRDSHLFKCQFAHQLTQADLRNFKLTMNKMDELLQEVPNPESVAWKVFVMPQVRERLLEKFHGRLWVTLGTLFDCLANDAVIFIGGEEAEKLRAKGLKNGASILSSIESATQLERERDEAIRKLDQVLGMLRDATGANGEPK